MKSYFKQKLLSAVTLEDVETARRLAETFLENGLDVMEITFRTEAAAEAIEAIHNEFPDMHIGAGTLLTPSQVVEAVDAGAQFGLSPGLKEDVVLAALEENFPFIPGVATPSEIEKALSYELNILKLFPIKNLGGTSYIKSLEGPYGHLDLQFIPMGGVKLSNLASYLECDSVIAGGGSWLAPKSLLQAQNFKAIGEIVRESTEIAG